MIEPDLASEDREGWTGPLERDPGFAESGQHETLDEADEGGEYSHRVGALGGR